MKPFANEEEEFQAYVDHRLPAEQAAAWAARVRDEPELAARVNAYRAQNAALHSLFDPVLDEPLPATWQVVPPAPHRPWLAANQPAWHMVAGVLLMVLGGLSGWLAHAWWQPQPVVAALPRQAAIAHVVYSPDVRRPVEIGADHEEQLVTWLSKRLGTPVRPPRLSAQGYELIGGRLLPGNQGPVAQFMYHDGSGQRLTLYVSNELFAQRETAFRFAQEGPVSVFYWVDGRFGYALSAGIPKAELATIATAVYDQLERH